jgi:hypothetical protein
MPQITASTARRSMLRRFKSSTGGFCACAETTVPTNTSSFKASVLNEASCVALAQRVVAPRGEKEMDGGPIRLRPTDGDVRFGSLADVRTAKSHVRFTPESGHVQCNSIRPLCANSGHSAAQSQCALYSRKRTVMAPKLSLRLMRAIFLL